MEKDQRNYDPEDKQKHKKYTINAVRIIYILKAEIRTGTEAMTRIYGKELCT